MSLNFAIGLTVLTGCGRIWTVMNFSFLRNKNNDLKKKLSDTKQEALIKTGREQFKKLVERGTELPVVLL